MDPNKLTEWRELAEKKLLDLLTKEKKALNQLQLGLAFGKVKDTSKIQRQRQRIAQISTILSEKLEAKVLEQEKSEVKK